ncbi:hypothetical protein AB0L82_26150 [Nocardia sp. NPDC052001]|uniref:hypothetical protein n=1 Tax=Nocardia sp. NPDC052001 TaxID=3154853 RepID=UPI003445F464
MSADDREQQRPEQVWTSEAPSDEVWFQAQESGGAVFVRGDGHFGVEYRIASAADRRADLQIDLNEETDPDMRKWLRQELNRIDQASAGRSALADHKPGSALSNGSEQDTERDGAER